VTLVYKKGPDCGIARILVEGKAPGAFELDCYAPEVDWAARKVLTQGLPKGRHTVTVEVTGRKNDKSANTFVQVVSLEVKGN